MPTPDFSAFVRRLVPRTADVVEAMFVTAENHSDVDAWVVSKGHGWHTHPKNWGRTPGLGVSPNGSGDRTVSVEDGQWLLYDSNGFHTLANHFLDLQYMDENLAHDATSARIADLEWGLDLAITSQRELQMDTVEDEELRVRVLDRLRAVLGRAEMPPRPRPSSSVSTPIPEEEDDDDQE